jgi:AraC-like DNA-binding protein
MPFSIEVLELHILLASRRIVLESFVTRLMLEPGQEVIINREDNRFVRSILKYIEDNLTNPMLSVSLIARHAGMSEPVLYKKVRGLTIMTVNELTKKIRMKNALQLLEAGYRHSEVSLLIGHQDQKYFARELKKMFGPTPSKWGKHAVRNDHSS